MDPTTQALVARGRHHYPELVSALAEVGQYVGLAPSSTTRGMPQIEDIIARTNIHLV